MLDEFVYEHPDFSLNGAKAIFSLTGYYGILGYRTQDDRDIAADSPDRPAFDAYRASEIEAVKPVIERLKETGWTFGSHTWGHIRLDTKPLQTVINDTERWADEVGSLVGPTQILFYPHGGRPDGRALTQVRPIWCEAGILPRTHGSAVFTRGQTQVMSICTLGSMSDVQTLDGISAEESKRYICLLYTSPSPRDS